MEAIAAIALVEKYFTSHVRLNCPAKERNRAAYFKDQVVLMLQNTEKITDVSDILKMKAKTSSTFQDGVKLKEKHK